MMPDLYLLSENYAKNLRCLSPAWNISKKFANWGPWQIKPPQVCQSVRCLIAIFSVPKKSKEKPSWKGKKDGWKIKPRIRHTGSGVFALCLGPVLTEQGEYLLGCHIRLGQHGSTCLEQDLVFGECGHL